MVKLQNIILPSTQNCTEEALYFRRTGNVRYSLADALIPFDENASLFFDTYFNGFSASKWFRYTKISNVNLNLTLNGKFRITLYYKEKQPSGILTRIVKEFYVDTKEAIEEIHCKFDTEYTQGMYCFGIMAMQRDCKFYNGYYYTDIDEQELRDVHLAIVICTFKREKYIYKNIGLLNNSFLKNENSELFEKLDVIVSDNAKSLNKEMLSDDKVHVFDNKNVGGSGGFTRGLIESINLSKEKEITHVLLMDDDVVIQPESIYRTYKLLTLLKNEYTNSYIGGAMLRMDKQWFQTESGGSWNSGYLVSHKCGLDLRNLDACLYNEFEEKCEFNAWWYCTIPMSFVRYDNLPIPIFIRGDDVEYGMRNMANLILLNGICVWHEPFEFKYSSSMYYYIFRNRLIDNALHNRPYSKKSFVKDFKKQFIREVKTLRYKNAWLLLDGANDFLKGIDWLKEQDGEVLNKSIMEKGYKLQYIDNLKIPFSYPEYEQTINYCESKKHQIIRKLCLDGLFFKAQKTKIVPVIDPHIAYFYRVGYALNYDIASKKGFETYRSRKEVVSLKNAYRSLVKLTRKRYDFVVKEYNERKSEIININFWSDYLNL